MANLNPIQLLMMTQQKNPRIVAEEIINKYYPNDPTMQNLLQLGIQGNSNGIKIIAQQLLQQRGLDLNSAMEQMFSLLNSSGK